jgi:hypothetical protein
MAKTQLTFVLSENALSVAELDGDQVTALGTVTFQGRKDFQYKEQIQEFLAQLDIHQKTYDEYSLSWFNPLSTLVPMNIFGASNAEQIYKACFTQETASNDIDYNRISELSVVNVFDIPLWVKSFFVIRYPRIVMQHEGSHLLRGIFSGSTFKLGVHIVLHAQHFQLVIVKHNGLLFYNTFESNAVEDVLYYTAFSLQQQELSNQAGNLFIYETSDSPAGMHTALRQQIKSLKELQLLTDTETKYLHFKYQQTCV